MSIRELCVVVLVANYHFIFKLQRYALFMNQQNKDSTRGRGGECRM
jgi:hypothetical protein